MIAEPPVGVVIDTASMVAFARGDGRIAEAAGENCPSWRRSG
jgi:hypothetical protein